MRDDKAAPGERVRFCLACGAVVDFDERTCPACGHYDPAPAEPFVPTVACAGCGQAMADTLQFCPACGRERPEVWPGVPALTAPLPEPPRGPATAFLMLAWLAPLLALLALALALRA
jgi:RNA polymerase subunit RPABC4/transcription elongation factor Spt4